ncbi:chemotaxis protein CheC [Peptoclostridium litorale DSM 5388]|uniref:CheY-P phosphatase CheC n=1 Tax=Peptoclostridium litorale DSM 5388 TaxID=1121324 RepID=A0A069RLX3_PEPLI|nr:chemotaxis protein CheC [Peptoclostridium litorale]KDR95187.1 CheY-P phosphatase CheC [Peptoclostridium litorale DSM 5388]SIN73644.1 chemotaxis protein CheC [Peptoclostridium litorale DSM 5388]
MTFKINNYYMDILKEIGNIGAGNALTALSTLINKKVDMEVPVIEIIETEKIVEAVEAAEKLIVGVYVSFWGDISGNIMLVFDKESTDHLMEFLFGSKSTSEFYTEMELSALQEIGNILSSAYINSISKLSNLNIQMSVPSVSVDMAASILSVPAIEYSEVSDKIILIENKILEGLNEIVGKLFFMPDIESFTLLFKNLGV